MTSRRFPRVMVYVPGSDSAKLQKSRDFDVDAVIVDLEDSVAPSAKASARAECARELTQSKRRGQSWVRVNDLGGDEWLDDIAAVVLPGLDGIIVPKTESAGQLEELDSALLGLERERELAPRSILLLATIETPVGMDNLPGITQSTPRLRCLGFGAGDFSRVVGVEFPATSGGSVTMLDRVRTDIVLRSSLASLEKPHDGVFGDFRDLALLAHEATRARQMGFGGKHAIHPLQIPILMECFAPRADEVDRARKMVAAYEASVAKGQGATSVDGHFVDKATYEGALEIVRRSQL
ncbi:MAG: HpcH/HpaI aldolase/citrate lyase family protein [Acidimicrobiales bacterium]